MEYTLNIEKHLLKTIKINVPDNIDNLEKRLDYVEEQLEKYIQDDNDLNLSIKDLGYKVTSTLAQYESKDISTNWFTPDMK